MAKYGWYPSNNTPKAAKASDAFKRTVENAMKPLLERATAALESYDESKDMNQGISFFGKWNRNFYYVYQKLKTPPNSMVDEFDYGVARMKYVGDEKFNLAYFRHTGKWYDLFTHEGLSLEESMKAIENESWFLVGYI